ncbi:MAG: hypothetical protein WCZ89_00915 [Phycisphaerae bacterium]
MKRTKSLLFIACVVFCCVVLAYMNRTSAAERTYEINTEYSLPEYRTDTARAIDAYQQMINRLLDSNERNNFLIIAKLDAIQKDLQVLSAKIEKMEKAMEHCQKKCCGNQTVKKDAPDPNMPAPEPLNKSDN